MLGNIKEVVNNTIYVNLQVKIEEQPNLIGFHVVFENPDSPDRKVVAEVVNTNREILTANIVGELDNGKFSPGASIKPSFKCMARIIKTDELATILGNQNITPGYTNFGTSNIYSNYKINVSINEFFNTHFTILGNSGSGKSCTVASIVQKLFTECPQPPISSHIIFFDAYGEYTRAFGTFHEKNPDINYKSYTTNTLHPDTEILQIPIWLLDVDDLALLLDCTTPLQLPILEKTIKLVQIISGNGPSVEKKKNDIIARALQDILLSGSDSTKIRDQVTATLTKFNTPSLNLESKIVQPGYVRTLKQCLYIDKTGKMQEMELVVEFVRGFILEDEIKVAEEELNKFYSLEDLELALDFALVSEGILKSEKVFDYANVVSVRLHTLVNGSNAIYFRYPKKVDKNQYIEELMNDKKTGKACQIVNFNINYIDDRTAKVITKIISRMIFLKVSTLEKRGSKAYHIFIEEAHRYVQHDADVDLLGYNIFERIAKEGRKYGAFLGLITQRPSELSDTCVAQCGNFIILRTMHPKDLAYIKDMVPSISEEIILQLKNLKPGNCVAFGSAFKVPISMKMDLPDPQPLSNNVDLEKIWFEKTSNNTTDINGSGISNISSYDTNQQQSADTFFAPNQKMAQTQQAQMQMMTNQTQILTNQLTQNMNNAQ